MNGPRFRSLIFGPVKMAFFYETCTVNGYKFRTKSTSSGSSGVMVKCGSRDNIIDDYYGQLQEIIKLVYRGGKCVYLFQCDWFDSADPVCRLTKIVLLPLI